MHAAYHKYFKKLYKQLPEKVKNKANERILLLLEDSGNILLNNHPLSGKYEGYRSINVSGDLRIIFKILDENTILLTEIGTHSKLYH
jgi:addiction module RelE/StbE family toxin